MIPINRNPTLRQLRLFAALVFPLFWGWVAFLVWRRAEWPRLAIAIAAAAVVISIVGLISPAFMKRVWIGMMVGLFGARHERADKQHRLGKILEGELLPNRLALERPALEALEPFGDLPIVQQRHEGML